MRELEITKVGELSEVSNGTETEEVVEKKGFVQEHKKAITIGAIGAGLLTVVGLVWAAVKKSKSAEDEYVSFNDDDDDDDENDSEEN